MLFGLPMQRYIGLITQVSLVVEILDYRLLENGYIQQEVKYQGMRLSWVSEKRLAQDEFIKWVRYRDKHEIEDTRTRASWKPREEFDARGRPIGRRLYMKASEQELKDVNALDHCEE
jgi:hypothetical protein